LAAKLHSRVDANSDLHHGQDAEVLTTSFHVQLSTSNSFISTHFRI